MIYITGDCHGDYQRFNAINFPEQNEMTKNDYVIVAGDFGFWSDDENQRYWLDWLDNLPYTTLWVDGNHENYDLLANYPVELWCGGNVQFIKPSVIHLCRGQVFEIDSCKLFTFGGASSHDISGGILEIDDPMFKEKKEQLYIARKPYRINHFSWWKEELPSQEELATGILNLKRHNDKVDYIVTHCCSTSTQLLMSAGLYKGDLLTDYLEKLKNTVDYKRWFFGHYHDNKAINDKEILVYDQIVRIW